MEELTLQPKNEYTRKQLESVMHNQQIILDITEPHLENKDLELLYTLANDSMCRLEGIINYPEEDEEDVEDEI